LKDALQISRSMTMRAYWLQYSGRVALPPCLSTGALSGNQGKAQLPPDARHVRRRCTRRGTLGRIGAHLFLAGLALRFHITSPMAQLDRFFMARSTGQCRIPCAHHIGK
jgi:hypothetical protein